MTVEFALRINPYRIETPALVSFSGGRTSGYLLWHILDAFGGKLPDDAHVVFFNTGKEREETLAFVQRCASEWAERMGGFPCGRTLDTSLEQSYGRDEVVLAGVTPGVREYDWKKAPFISFDGLICPWLDGSEGIGLGDMLWHD